MPSEKLVRRDDIPLSEYFSHPEYRLLYYACEKCNQRVELSDATLDRNSGPITHAGCGGFLSATVYVPE